MTIEQLEKEFEEHKRENEKVHSKIIDRLVSLEKDSILQAERYRVILENLNVITKKVELIEEKPAKKWEDMTNKIMWGIVGAILTFVLVKVGIG